MTTLKLFEFGSYCSNGEETVLKTKEIILEAKRNHSGKGKTIRPISLMVLDL